MTSREAASAVAGGSPDLKERVQSLRLPASGAGRRGPSLALVLFWAFPWVACLGLGALVVVQRLNPPTAAPSANAPPTPSPASPGAAAPLPAPSRPAAANAIVLESKGYIIPAHQILVSPQVNGRILELPFVEGQRVQKGEVLAIVDATEFQAEVDRCSAALEAARQRLLELERGARPEELAQAEAELAQGEAEMTEIERSWRRNKELANRNVLTEQDLEQAESRYNAQQKKIQRLDFALKLMREGPRQERIAAARAEVRQATAELTRAEWRLGNCTIRAPITGTILKKNAEEGNLINPVAFNGSFSLCDMADLSDLEVDLSIQERQVAGVFPGQACRIRSEAYPDRVYSGRVSRLMPIADRAKGAIPVRVKLSIPAEEEGVYLKPEMGATVSFLAKGAGEEEPTADAGE